MCGSLISVLDGPKILTQHVKKHLAKPQGSKGGHYLLSPALVHECLKCHTFYGCDRAETKSWRQIPTTSLRNWPEGREKVPLYASNYGVVFKETLDTLGIAEILQQGSRTTSSVQHNP